MVDTDTYVLEYLDENFRSVEGLKAVNELLDTLQTQQKALGEQILEAKTRMDTTQAESASHARSILEEVDELSAKRAEYEMHRARSEEWSGSLGRLRELDGSLRDLDVAYGYASILAKVKSLSIEASSLITTDPRAALIPYASLRTLAKSLRTKNIDADSSAIHLIEYVDLSSDALWEEMKRKLSEGFKGALEDLGWPTIVAKSMEGYEEKIAAFRIGFEKLLVLEQPDANGNDTSSQSGPLLAFSVLTEPLDLRFRYHFQSNRTTNRPDRPEWFFTHLLTLFEDHSAFINTVIQPILASTGLGQRIAMNELITAMLPTAERKLKLLLVEIEGHAKVWSHLVHETLRFDDAVRERWMYVPFGQERWNGTVETIIGTPALFEKWLSIEGEFDLMRYHEILASPDAWQLEFEGIDPAVTKPTKSALRLKDMLDTILTRFAPLPRFDHRVNFFLDVQLAILEGYLDRLNGICDAFETLSSSIIRAVPGVHRDEARTTMGVGGLERLCRAYGSAVFLEETMREWSEDVFFVELWQDLADAASDTSSDEPIVGSMGVEQIAGRTSRVLVTDPESGTLFDETMEAYQTLRVRAETLIVRHLSKEMANEGKTYARLQSWSSVRPAETTTISPEFAQPIQSLTAMLSFLSTTFAYPVFLRLYRSFSSDFQHWIWEHIVERNKFSEHGGRQFKRDMEGLWQACGEFCARPAVRMGKVEDACVVLGLPTAADGKGEVLDLWSVLRELDAGGERANVVMGKLGLTSVDLHEARWLVGRRIEAVA
ncbi:hypothetical protein SAICODRAFT_8970 [Saitoella complicata NRRL Y-17804]|nr:uncharacterized protein SAICODRAFT_8970 [Saitoella complicata NRRL Y-17804]ODQ51315.1 hypothetical protein SAICODRAFT_8970 [Saitoella complicata NRRL Y-17804]